MATVSSLPATPKGIVIVSIVVVYLASVPERHLKASQVDLRKPQTTALSNTNCLLLSSNTLLAQISLL